MSAVANPTSAEAVLRATAADLLAHVDEHIVDCGRHIAASMPELRDDELTRGLLESAGDNFRLLFTAQRDGLSIDELRAPRGAVAYAEIMVRRGVPLTTLLRAYRFGLSYLFESWQAALRQHTDDAEELAAALELAMSQVFAYVDHVCDEVTEAYTAARERWSRSAAAIRTETVEELLSGDPCDPGVAGSRLSYELHRHHVAFVITARAWDEGADTLHQLEGAAGALAGELGCARPLLITRGRAELWMWVGLDAPPGSELGDLSLPPGHRGIVAACGGCSEDLEGFRRSHAEAVEAMRLATLADRRGARVVAYGKVVVNSLLTTDAVRAARFVAAELGPLAADDDATRRTRATLQAYLECGSRCAATARRLGVHQNTVAYRLQRAEALLGHEVGHRRFELEAALRLLPLVADEAPPCS